MAARPKKHMPPSRDNDSMEAIKPLVVLVLFGTILYGAYSVVQKGPSPGSAETAEQSAPAFQPPQVEVPAVASPQAAVAVAPGSPVAPAASTPVAAPPATPPAPLSTPPTTAATLPAAATPPAAVTPAAPAPEVAPAAATALAAAPTYLNAESAPPPANDPVAASRPDRFATLPGADVPPAGVAAVSPPPATSAATVSSSAFAGAWSDAHDMLAAGRYAEALAGLSVWYDDPSLSLEESQRLEDLLAQLAGTVFYSQQDLLLPPYVVAAGETLPAIAAPLGVSWQLLAKINGVSDPMKLVSGEHLKLVRGPFDAVVSISRRRLSLQLAGSYAGGFPVVVGRQFLSHVGGSLPVLEIRRGTAETTGTGGGRRGIVLGSGLVVEAADDPNVVSDDSPPSSLVVSVRDLDELLDILGPGSRVLVRQ